MDEGLLGGAPAPGEGGDARGGEGDGWADDLDDIDASVRQAFLACDLDSSGRVSAAELHAVIAAIGCNATLPQVIEILKKAESHVSRSQRELVTTASGRPATAGGGGFAREFAPLRLSRRERPRRRVEEQHGLKKVGSAVIKPIVAARRAIERAVFRVIHSAAQSHVNDIGEVVIEFEGIRCQFGRASDAKSAGLVGVTLDLDRDAGILTIRPTDEGGDRRARDLRASLRVSVREAARAPVLSRVNLSGCRIDTPKVPRRGYPHAWRLDTAQPDSNGVSKFTFAAAQAEDMHAWMEQLREYESQTEEELARKSLEDGELDMREFQALLRHDLAALLPGDWRSRCAEIVKLRRAFLNADLDGDQTIERDELEVVLLSGDATKDPTIDEIDALWAALDPEGKGKVDWFGFLRAKARINSDPQLASLLDIDHPNRWALISLLIDVPCDAQTERELLEEMSAVERKGVWWLSIFQSKLERHELRDRLKRACDGRLRYKTKEQIGRIVHIRWALQAWLMLIALFTNSVAALWENYLMWSIGVDSFGSTTGGGGGYLLCNNCSGVLGGPDPGPFNPLDWDGFSGVWDCAPLTPTCDIKGNAINPAGWFDENLNSTVFHAVTFGLLTSRKEAGYTCVCGSDGLGNATASGVGYISMLQGEGIETCLEFWGLNVPMILLTVLLEIYLLGFAALRSSCLIAAEYEFRLTPLNETRAFVAIAFIRATFEMGNPHSAVLGVDPTVKSNLQKKLETSVLGLIYVLKVLIVGILIKTFLWQPFIPMKYFTWLGSHAPTVSSIFWDGLIGHVIMDQVELRASGVTASTELFNELLDEFDVSATGADDEPPSAAAGTGAQGPEPEPEPEPEPSRSAKPVLSLLCKIQVVRAIGLAIIENGTMYPPMELLLRHAVQYFDLPAQAGVDSESFDYSAESLRRELRRLPVHEQRLVACVHLLAMLLDGTLSYTEIPCFEDLYAPPETDETDEPEDGAAAATESVSNPTFDDGGLDGGAGTPDLIGDRKTLLPRLFQLSHRYRARQFITADCLRHAIAGDRVEDLEFPFWRNCCGRGWDLVKCRPIKYAKGRKLKSWSWFRYSEELWNLLTYKLV